MKLTIIGAASPRFPLLLHSLLSRTDLCFDEVSLFDSDGEKLGLLNDTVLEEILQFHGSRMTLTVSPSLEEAVDGSAYIFSSFRTGGQRMRGIDEAAAISCGQIGQETVGVGGYLLALRTIPVVLEQIKVIERRAPHATLINFTNPSGLVTQAVCSLTGFSRIVGICDAPQIIADYVASAFDCQPEQVGLSYYGLNHLGWAHSITIDGKEVIDELIDHRLDRFFAAEPFYADLEQYIRRTRMIPNEYLYYYVHTQQVLENQRRSGKGRAEVIQGLDATLYAALSARSEDPLKAYNRYIDRRNSSYMTLESSHQRNQRTFSLLDQHTSNGYDAIALGVLSSLVNGSDTPMILNIKNDGFDPQLQDDDIIEVSAVNTGGWFRPMGILPHLPDEARSLLMSIKVFERRIIEAVRSGKSSDAIAALGAHPFVETGEAAALYRCIMQARSALEVS